MEPCENSNLGMTPLDQLTDEQILTMDFETIEEADEFYMEYGKVNGFGVRRDEYGYSNQREIISRRWVCWKEGKRASKNVENRARAPKAETRCECGARFRIHKNRTTQRWYVSQFVRDHNHDLVPPRQVRYLPCYRNISEADAAQIENLSRAGVRTSHTIAVMKEQAGGFDKMGFTAKDVYNRNIEARRSTLEIGDANAAFAYLRGKQDTDEQFFLEYSIDEGGRLEHMLWADGMCRLDYECFGDVLAFDSTYKTNVYNRPFVVFSGVNHHKQTAVFAATMLANEKIEAYSWALQSLLRCMNGKIPKTVVTDGDSSMRAAIEIVFPTATHRLCKWHLQRNAQSNVKNSEFTKEFKRLARIEVATHEWDAVWDEAVYRLGVDDHPWVKDIKRRRESWAAAYLHGKFFCGISTTSRCEGVNAHLKRFLVEKYNLYEFMHHFDRALSHLREKETKADFETLSTIPFITTSLHQLERHASTVYSRAAYKMFQKQLAISNAFNFVGKEDDGDVETYVFCKFGQPDAHRIVEFNINDATMKCSCARWEANGILCAHMISTMKVRHLLEIPSTCILNRWIKNPKDWDSLSSQPHVSQERLTVIRYGALLFDCRRMCSLASQSTNTYDAARKDIAALTSKVEKLRLSDGNQAAGSILDPLVGRSKGSSKKKGVCSGSRKRGVPTTRGQ